MLHCSCYIAHLCVVQFSVDTLLVELFNVANFIQLETVISVRLLLLQLLLHPVRVHLLIPSA